MASRELMVGISILKCPPSGKFFSEVGISKQSLSGRPNNFNEFLVSSNIMYLLYIPNSVNSITLCERLQFFLTKYNLFFYEDDNPVLELAIAGNALKEDT